MKKWLFALLIPGMLAGNFSHATEIKITVKGMVCAFCAQGITKKFKAEPGVEKVDVSLAKQLVTLDLKKDNDIPDAKIKDILEDAGYTVEKIERP